MITIKQLNNDLIAMEKQGLVKRCGYAYNGARDPEPKYQLTQGGSDKFWTYELEHLSDADKTTLERCGYRVTAEGLRRYIETQP
jgi:DNA-binding HxlR family transcriptional regulator